MTYDTSTFKIEKTVVEAKSRTLSASWTFESNMSEKEWNELQQKEYEVLAEVADTPDVYNHMLCLLGLSYADYLDKIARNNDTINEIYDDLSNILTEEINKDILASIMTTMAK